MATYLLHSNAAHDSFADKSVPNSMPPVALKLYYTYTLDVACVRNILQRHKSRELESPTPPQTPMPTIIRTMLVEDNRDYRSVIEHALEVEPDIELVSQFSTPEIALRSLEDHKTRKVADLILLDLRLPGMDGLEALPWFLKALPDAKVIILTQSDAEADVLQAIKLGAAGYLLKSTRADQLIDGIRNVMSGGASLEAGVARLIIETLQTKLPDNKPEQLLSKRELEILTLLAEGLAKKEICNQLKISYSTVDTHVAHIYNKLDASNAPAAISKAYRKGILKTD